MTKRLTLVGLAAVAAVWGPFVYAELARRPLAPTSDDARAIEASEPVQATPVVFAPAPSAEPAQPAVEPTVTAIEPAVNPPPAAAAAEPELAAQPAEPEEPAQLAQQQQKPPIEAAEAVAQAVEPPPPPAAAEEHADKVEPAAAEQPATAPAEHAAKPEAPSAPAEATDFVAAAAQAEALAPAFRSTFDRETRDAQWAEREEPRLTQLLSSSGVPATAISEVRCQSTVCRVSFTRPGSM